MLIPMENFCVGIDEPFPDWLQQDSFETHLSWVSVQEEKPKSDEEHMIYYHVMKLLPLQISHRDIIYALLLSIVPMRSTLKNIFKAHVLYRVLKASY